MNAGGAGRYGSVGFSFSRGKMSQGVAGNSNVMPAKSIPALNGEAQRATQAFVAQGKKMAQGAAGNSKIHIKA